MNGTNQENARITTALLLAAGTGSRLQPLTDDSPKCLTEINGVPILERLIACLHEQQFKRLVVVVGYLENSIRRFLGERAGDLTVDYIVNPRYRTTNNLFSLWLARKMIDEPFLLLESDLIFNVSQLDDMLYPDKCSISSMSDWMKGTTVTINPSNRITAFRVGAGVPFKEDAYKTVNIYSLSLHSWRLVLERLESYISAGKVNEYYETVFAEMVADGTLSFQAVLFEAERWYEIDTLEDLRQAELIFPAAKEQLATRRVSLRHYSPVNLPSASELVSPRIAYYHDRS